MISKGIWVGLVAVAFVAGSITTGTMAYGTSIPQGKPFLDIEKLIQEIGATLVGAHEEDNHPIEVGKLVETVKDVDELKIRIATLEGIAQNHEARLLELEAFLP